MATKTKEKPIIFSGPSIPAIQNLKPGTWPPEPIDPSKSWKWQTRRIVPEHVLDKYYDYDEYCNMVMPTDIPCKREYEKEYFARVVSYPPGTVLWVRETWAHAFADTTVCGSTYALQDQYVYKADNPDLIAKWRPSIHMPREAARLFLEVKSARVEKLQEITEEDAIAEGVRAYGPNNCSGTSARIAFAELWDSINGKKYPWESNPWVFVYEFGRVEP